MIYVDQGSGEVVIYTEHGPNEEEIVYSAVDRADANNWLEVNCGVDFERPDTGILVAYKIREDGEDRPMSVAQYMARQCDHLPGGCDCSEYLEFWA